MGLWKKISMFVITGVCRIGVLFHTILLSVTSDGLKKIVSCH